MAELEFVQSDLETIDHGVSIRITGVIDVDTADSFRTTLLATVKAGGRRMLLDFSGVEYVESAGFACLVELSQHLRETGGIAVLSAMQAPVQDVILSLGLDAFFGIADTEEKALTLLKWSAPTAQPREADDMDGADSIGFTIEHEHGQGHSSGELLPFVPAETAMDEALFPDASPMNGDLEDSDDLVAEDYRMAPVGDASGVVTADDVRSWEEAEPTGDFSKPGESSELTSIARAIGAPDRSSDDSTRWISAQQMAASGESGAVESDVRITSQDPAAVQHALEGGAAPPPPPPGAIDAEPVPVAVPVPVDAIAEPMPMVVPASAEIAQAEPEAQATAADYVPAMVEEAEAVPASQSVESVPAEALAEPADSEPADDIPAAAPRPVDDKEAEELRLSRLRATAKLLQSIPEEDRLWRKVLVYLSHSPGEATARLNLVVSRLPGNRGKDAFPVASANPWVTVRPRLPGAICVPDSIAIDVENGEEELDFRIKRDPNPDRPDAPTAPPRLEIWYGPSVIRTVHTANPFGKPGS